MSIDSRLDVLLSIACADALGAATEFKTPQQIARIFAPDAFSDFQPGSPFGFAPGEATDDTQMIVAHLLRPDDPWAGFQAWVGTNPPDVGGLTRDALATSGYDAWEASGRHSAGNGGLMRIAATWLVGHRGTDLLAHAAHDTALTHADPRCVQASLVLVALMEALAAGTAHDVAVHASLDAVRGTDVASLMQASGLVPDDVLPLYDPDAEAFATVEEATLDGLAQKPGPQGGYVIDTLQQAVRRGGAVSWSDGIVPIVMLGDDSDTVAAVAGAILGARGITAPERLTTTVRLGTTWPGWEREWPLAANAHKIL